MINLPGQTVETWVLKLLLQFHNDPTVEEGERADPPRLRNSAKNPKIFFELSLSLSSLINKLSQMKGNGFHPLQISDF